MNNVCVTVYLVVFHNTSGKFAYRVADRLIIPESILTPAVAGYVI